MGSLIAECTLAVRATCSRSRGRGERAVAVVGLCLAAGLIGVPAAAAAGGLRTITVDASQRTGGISSLQGVSGTPLPGDGSHSDFTSQFQHDSA